MNVLLVYLLKVAALQIILLVFYWLFLRRDTFYTMVRYYFLSGVVLSYIIPLVYFNITVNQPVDDTIGFKQFFLDSDLNVTNVVNSGVQYSFAHFLIAVITLGTITMCVRFFVQYLALNGLHVKHRKKCDAYTILSVDMPIKPFSFGKRIYLNPDLHNPQELDEIINHELVHIRQNHNVDIFIGILNKCLFWWNPAAWIMNTAIRNNLEYIVDNEMLQLGFDRKHYQYHLLYISQLPYSNRIANHFNLSNLKKRIMMMNKEKTQTLYKAKLLLLIPVIAVFFLSFNLRKSYANNFTDNSAIVNTDSTKISVIGYGVFSDILDLKGSASKIVVTGTSISKKGELVTDPLIIIDEKESTSDVLRNLNPEGIKSINILKDDSATSVYGDKAKNGAIKVTLNNLKGESDNRDSKLIIKSVTPINSGLAKDVLIFVDGKEYSMDEMSTQLNLDKIESISVLKDDDAKSQYGEKGKNGVILITLKKQINSFNYK